MMPWLAHLQPLSRSRAWTCWAATSAPAPTRQSLGEQAPLGPACHPMHVEWKHKAACLILLEAAQEHVQQP